MAGEVTKTTRVTNADATPAITSEARHVAGTLKQGHDKHSFAAATELEAADTKIFDIDLPSNAIVCSVEMLNDDMDTGCAPALVLDVGVVAKVKHTSVTSGTETTHSPDDVISSDLLVDGSAEGQSANTAWTTLALDTTNFAAGSADKQVWELLGYDSDPKTTYRVGLTSQVASSALASAADCELRVTYRVD